MTLWLIAGIMAALVVALLLWPLFQLTGAPESRRGFDLAVYRDQLAEVERDLDRGVLTEEQAAAARHEVERRLLGVAEATPPDEAVAAGATSRWTPLLALGLAVVLPVGGVALYVVMGSPQTPSLPFAERPVIEEDAPGDLPRLVEQLARRIAESPEDPRGWRLLGRSYGQLGRYQEAAEAFRQAIAQGEDGAAAWADLGEMLIAANEGVVVPEAAQALAEALKRDPAEPRSRYYSGLALAQDDRMEQALEVWETLADDGPADAPWNALLGQQIAAARRSLGLPAGPDAADMAAASDMTSKERDTFIRSMVERLATRLEQEPEDLDGWLRLTQAYRVLGERGAAAEALKRAAALVADLPPESAEHDKVARARAALAESD